MADPIVSEEILNRARACPEGRVDWVQWCERAGITSHSVSEFTPAMMMSIIRHPLRVHISWAQNNMRNLPVIELRDVNMSDACLEELSVRNLTLDGVDLSGASLDSIALIDSTLTRVNLRGAMLSGYIESSTIDDCDISDMRSGELDDTIHFIRCKIYRSSFERADLLNACFGRCALDDVNFSGASLDGLGMHDSTLNCVHFSGAKMRGTTFRNCAFEDCTFNGISTGAIFRDCVINGDHGDDGEGIEGASFTNCMINGRRVDR